MAWGGCVGFSSPSEDRRRHKNTELMLKRNTSIGLSVIQLAFAYAQVSLALTLLLLASACSDPKRPTITLSQAAANGDLAQIDTAIRQGAKLDDLSLCTVTDLYGKSKSQSLTGLQAAAIQRQAAAMRHLLELGAKPNAKNAAGNTALFYAARTGDQRLAQILIDAHADPNIANDGKLTPLFIALLLDKRPMVKLLLEHGADPNWKDQLGVTPLFFICFFDSNTVAQMYNLPPALSNAAGDSISSSDLVKLLGAAGVDPNLPSMEGFPPLCAAAMKGRIDLVDALLSIGANINIDCREGATPLDMVAEANNKETALYLLRHGAKYRLSQTSAKLEKWKVSK